SRGSRPAPQGRDRARGRLDTGAAIRRGRGRDGPSRVPPRERACLHRHGRRVTRIGGRRGRGDASMSETVHPRADEIDSLSTTELVELMHAEDRSALDAIRPQLGHIARAIDVIADRIPEGGRLHYFGAGTSGRIAALDAVECPATFGIAKDLVQAHE